MRRTSGTLTAVGSATWDRGTGGAAGTRSAALGLRRAGGDELDGGIDEPDAHQKRRGPNREAQPVLELLEPTLHTPSASRCWCRCESAPGTRTTQRNPTWQAESQWLPGISPPVSGGRP